MAIDLTSRVCLVTGATAGIGAALVRGFAARGAQVVASDLQPPQHREAAWNCAYDVSKAEQAEATVQTIVERFGRLDVFIANAAIMPRQNWNDISPDDWRAMLQVNLDGAWHGAQAAARVMTKQGYGKIIFVSSVEVELGVAVHCHYDASKAAIIGLTRSLARAIGPEGVRVNCVMPGAVLTASELQMFPDQQQIARDMALRQCLPDRLLPEQIEPVFAFLAAAESDCIAGQVICADHGLVFY